MKKYFAALVLAILSQQALAVSVAGIEFLDVADTLNNANTSGTFLANYTTPGETPQFSGADGNGATYTYGAVLEQDSILGVSFGSAVDVTGANLTILFADSNPHTGTLSLLGGSGGTSAAVDFSLTPYIAGPPQIFTGYSGFNTVSPTGTTLGVFALTINLADEFGSDFGTFTDVQLQITGDNGVGGYYDAAPALIGTTSIVPLPAAVWLFGSGLVGLAGIARKRA